MRFILPASAVALMLATVSSVSVGQRPDSQIDKRSIALAAEGRALAAQGNPNGAIDVLESALAVDPKNRDALIQLADISEQQNLPGKAIRLYREALQIEPNDVSALSGQGRVLVQKGAITRAKENLARIEKICATTCAEQTKLASVIEKGEAEPVISAEAVQPKPVVTRN